MRSRRLLDADQVRTINSALAECAEGDSSACRAMGEALYRALKEPIEQFLVGWREATFHDAEDSVANVFVGLLERALDGKLDRPPRNWEAYLISCALRQCGSDMRKASRCVPLPPDVDLRLALYDGPHPDMQAADRDEIRTMFERALPRLTLMEKWVIAMRGQRWSYAEIADALSISQSSAYVLASKARRKLKVERFKLKAA